MKIQNDGTLPQRKKKLKKKKGRPTQLSLCLSLSNSRENKFLLLNACKHPNKYVRSHKSDRGNY